MKKILYTFIAALLFIAQSFGQIDRSQQPKPGPAPSIKLGTPKSFELKNGLKVMIVENHKLPRVNVTLAIQNGPIFEGDRIGVRSLTSSLLGTGTTNITKDDFNKKVDFLGANLNYSSQGASLNTLSKYFPEMIELMADGIKNPVFKQEEFDDQQKQLIENIKSGEKSVDEIASRIQSALVYGKNHPYGEFTTAEAAGKVTLENVKEFYNTYYKPNNAYLIIIGDVNYSKVKKLITKTFENWSAGTIPNYSTPTVTNVEKTEIDIVDMPNAVQSNISISNSTHLKKSDDDFFAALLANYILGSGGTGRLYKNLREEHGYTYGANSRVGNDHETASRFNAFASVRNMVTDSSVVEFMKEIKLLKAEKVSEEELKTAKAAYTGSFVRALENPSTAAQYALNIETENLPKNYYETYLKKLNAVTIDDVQKAANKYFKSDNFRIMIVGKAADIASGLEQLSYPINYFDKQGEPTNKPEFGAAIPEGITAKTVLNNYIKAIGGKEKVEAATSTMTNYEGDSPMGKIGQVEKRTGDKFAQITLVNGNAMATIITTQTEMFMKQGPNKVPLPAEFLEDTKGTLGVFYELAIMDNPRVKLSGIEKINDKDAYKIEMPGTAMSGTVYYDVETGLKVKEISVINMGGRTQTTEVNYSDYKEVDGILFADKKSTTLGPQVVEMTLKEALVNTGVTDADFK